MNIVHATKQTITLFLSLSLINCGHMTLHRIINANVADFILTVLRSCSSHGFPSASASKSAVFGENLTPLSVGSAILPWYKSTTPLEKECPTFCHPHQLYQRASLHLLHDSPALYLDGEFGGA
jgi:hypothetical protein